MKNTTRKMLEHGKLIKDIARHPFAFPGGYLRVLHNDGAICGICVKERFAEELYDATHISRDVFQFIIQDSEDIGYCEHCNKMLTDI